MKEALAYNPVFLQSKTTLIYNTLPFYLHLVIQQICIKLIKYYGKIVHTKGELE